MAIEELHLTKRRVVRGELDTAIELMVCGGDPVSAMVLTWAAIDVLRGVAESRGIPTFRSIVDQRIKPQHLKEWRDAERRAYIFSKHADKDPDGELPAYNPETCAFMLLCAVHDYLALYEQQTVAMLMYLSWFLARYPDLIVQEYAPLSAKARILFSAAQKPFSDSLSDFKEFFGLMKRNPSFARRLRDDPVLALRLEDPDSH